MSAWPERFHTWRNEPVRIPIPWGGSRGGSLKKPKTVIYEVLPSLNHENKGLETLINSFNMLFDTNRVVIDRKEAFGLEIYADKDRVSYHIVLPEQHNSFLYPRVQDTFKGSGFSRVEHSSARDFTSAFGEHSHAFTLQLKEHAFLPLNMETKPQMFEQLVSVLDNLESDEQVFVQMLLQPTDDRWQESFQETYQSWLKGESTGKNFGPKEMLQLIAKSFLHAVRNFGRNLLREEEEQHERRRNLQSVTKKLKQPGFKTSIRAVINTKEAPRRGHITRAITSSFRTLAKDNDFVSKSVFLKKRAIEQIKERKMPLITINNQILCTNEVVNLYKLPTGELPSTKLKRMTPEEKQVDEKITKKGMLLGKSVHQDDPKDIRLSVMHDDDMARIKLAIASPGGGKSTIIEQMVYEAKRHGHGAAIFDVADGQLYERIIKMLPEYQDDIVCVDYTDEEWRPAFNFDALGGTPATRGMIFAEFFEVMFKTENLTRAQSYLVKTALTVFSQSDTTLLEFLMVLRDKDYRNTFLDRIRANQPDLFLWWKTEVPKISEGRWNEIVAPIITRLDSFLYTQMKDILCQKGGKLTPTKWMDEGKIVVFNMSNGVFTEPEVRVLMSLHNYMFWNATLAREKMTRNGIRPRMFHLFYDEPQTYMGATPMFSRAISKARKYKVSVNFFVQEAEQVIKEASELWKEILGMSPHMLIGPVSEFTAKAVSKELDMSVEEILAIKKHKFHWILKTYADKEAVSPVVFKAVLPRDHKDRAEVTDVSHAEIIKKRWRKHFSTMPSHELQKDISARNMGMTREEYEAAIRSFQQENPEATCDEPTPTQNGLVDWGS